MNDALHPDPAEPMTISRQEAELLEWVRGSQDEAFHLHIHRVGDEWAVTRPESNYKLGRGRSFAEAWTKAGAPPPSIFSVVPDDRSDPG